MKKSVKILWRLFFAGIFIFIGLLLLTLLGVFGKLPSLEELENPSNNLTTQVYTEDDSLLTEYFFEDRRYCEFDSISPNVIDALISTEDERFYEHSGIDFRAVMRSISGVFTFSNKGGASTLSQQLAKNLFPRENSSIFKMPIIKMKEWILAVKLERNMTKQEILALYLNKVEFSDHTFGIFNAAQHFFSKLPKDLNVEEAAVLVGMLKGTSLFNPIRNEASATQRRNTVMSKMVDNHKLSKSEYYNLKDQPIALHLSPKRTNVSGMALYFRSALETELKEFLSKYKKPDGEPYNIYTDGLKVYSTIDMGMQRMAERVVLDHAKKMNQFIWSQGNIRSGNVWKKYNKYFMFGLRNTEHYRALLATGMADSNIIKELSIPRKMKIFAWNSDYEKDTTMSAIDSLKYMKTIVQSGFSVMDPKTGEVKAYVGGINFNYFRYDHCATYAKRQVGSSIKPLLYCLAITNGSTPCDVIPSGRVFFPGHGWYRGDNSRTGPMRMKDGLAYSKNPIAVNILKIVGFEKNFIAFLRKCGVESDLQAFPSIALGAAQISMMEMLRAYSMFPNKGINVKPIFFTRIEDRNGNVLFDNRTEEKEVITEEQAFIMARMMQGTVDYGTGKGMRSRYGVRGEMGGKTGTTNDNADAWFIGFTPQLLAGVWVGFDDPWIRFANTGIGQGASAAMPIWGNFFHDLLYDDKSEYDPRAEFDVPLTMKNQNICGVGSTYETSTTYRPVRNRRQSQNEEVSEVQQEINNANEPVPATTSDEYQ